MKTNLIRSFLAALLALAFFSSAYAGVQFNLSAPIDCTHYVDGGGTAVKFEIRSINYDTGVVRFQLLDASGHYLGDGAVFGVTMPEPSEDGVAAAIATEIASKG